jgi:PAS domain S-box-containing protein
MDLYGEASAADALRLAIAAGGIGTLDYDPVENLAKVSPEMRAMFGFPEDNHLTLEVVFSTIAAEDLSQAHQALREALDPEGSGQYRAKCRIRRASDGEERWISASGQALFADGKAVRLIAICRDVTNEMSLERLAACVAAIPGTICSFRQSKDRRPSFPYASDSFPLVFGFAPEEVRTDAAPVFACNHPEDKERINASIAESARKLSNWHAEFRYNHPQKGTIWLEGLSHPVPEPGGAIIWHGYVQDITARKRAEEELRESEARHRALFDSNLIGVCYSRCVNGVEGVLTEANDKYLEMVGYDRADLAAGRMNWIDMTPPEFQHVNKAAIAEYLTIGKNQHPVEKEYIRKNGTRVPVLVAGAWLDQATHTGGAFVLDISEQKRNEARERKFQADRIVVMQSMAAAIAHEINQPLTACLNYIKISRRLFGLTPERRPASIPEILDKASDQIGRAGEIVSRLRSFIAHGEPDKLHTSAHKLIQEALNATTAAINDAGVSASLQLNAAQDEILADKTQIVLVLANLIKNAVEAMESVRRRELVVATMSDKEKIRIDVIDTGVGLCEKRMASLFEPFVTTKPSGMGVGLSISRTMVKAHHGQMWAELNPEGGAIFSFTMPLANNHGEVTKSGEMEGSGPSMTAPAYAITKEYAPGESAKGLQSSRLALGHSSNVRKWDA